MIPGAVERVFPQPGHVHLYNVFRLEFDEVEVYKDTTKRQDYFTVGFQQSVQFCGIWETQEDEITRNRWNKLQYKQSHETLWRATWRVHNLKVWNCSYTTRNKLGTLAKFVFWAQVKNLCSLRCSASTICPRKQFLGWCNCYKPG